MLPYFPLSDDDFQMTMGISVLHEAALIEVDETRYVHEIALKNSLLTNNHSHYFQAPPDTEARQWETLAFILADMTLHYPHYFTLERSGNDCTWHNRLLAQVTTFQFGNRDTLPLQPLDWLGRQVQEDLLILDQSHTSGTPLLAVQLCFPNDWCLQDKIGKSFLDIHEEVPLFKEKIGGSSARLLERLKTERPVWRVNWGLKNTAQLDLTPWGKQQILPSLVEITSENAGECCFFRIERQTLSRLPHSKSILFTIHTYQESLAHITKNKTYAQHLQRALNTAPYEVLQYKGITPFVTEVQAYLEKRLH